jgi:hypothetical protein
MPSALQSIRSDWLPGVSPRAGILSELIARSEYLARQSTAPLVRPSHFAVGTFSPAVWFSLGRLRRSFFNFRTSPLVEFDLPPESRPSLT